MSVGLLEAKEASVADCNRGGSPGSQLILEVCYGGACARSFDLDKAYVPCQSKGSLPTLLLVCRMLLWISLILHHDGRFGLIVRADLGPSVV